jgi:hypothetical protein
MASTVRDGALALPATRKIDTTHIVQHSLVSRPGYAPHVQQLDRREQHRARERIRVERRSTTLVGVRRLVNPASRDSRRIRDRFHASQRTRQTGSTKRE